MSPKLKNLSHSNLLLASNRLPITIQQLSNGEYSFEQSSGGLVTALSGLKDTFHFQWYGAPGLDLADENGKSTKDKEDKLAKALQKEQSATPVFLDKPTYDLYYNIFSTDIKYVKNKEAWAAYKEVNRQFAKTIAKDVQDGSLIWVHDYHLMLLPKMLREEIGPRKNNVRIGFFLHIPFPSSDIFRKLPMRDELLLGLLGSDLIGFHTIEYVRNFRETWCDNFQHSWSENSRDQATSFENLRDMKAFATPTGVKLGEIHAVVEVFPAGIDPAKFETSLQQRTVQNRIAGLKSEFESVKLILGIDRLDYIKGIPLKLLAFEDLLKQYPEWVGNIVLYQVAIPSRQDIKEFQDLQDQVHELVYRINKDFGTNGFQHIRLINDSVPPDELTALYAASDICLVTSTRDGLNLVSMEYIATQARTQIQRYGVLVLSEFAGAARRLDGALLFNPWDSQQLTDKILEALTMQEERRKTNLAKLEKYVFKNTSARWGQSFVERLVSIDPRKNTTTGESSTTSRAELGKETKQIDIGGPPATTMEEAGTSGTGGPSATILEEAGTSDFNQRANRRPSFLRRLRCCMSGESGDM